MCPLTAHSFLLARSIPVTCVDGPQFDEPADGHPGGPWWLTIFFFFIIVFLTILNEVAMHILVQLFVWRYALVS